MTIHATGRPPGEQEECRIRIAAAGDVHYGGEHDRDRAKAAFAALAGRTDLVLLAGDLTTHGEPEQAAILADAAAEAGAPVVTVLGNHDWHSNRADEVSAVLEEAGIVVLDRSHHVVEACGAQVGIAGAKGFVGGFAGSHIPDFGEPLLREVYAQTSDDVEALDAGLREVAHCPYRIVLLHYSPCAETLRGEPEGIWAFLGNERIAAPIREHEPDLVLHGHAHAGTFEAKIGASPVYNVSVPVMGRNFWVLELASLRTPTTPIH
jgi:Icc-related predicted phosphoesterase